MRYKLIYILLFLSLSVHGYSQAGNDKKDKNKGRIIRITAADYEKETAEGLVLADFYANWCGACRNMNPILKDVAKKYQDRLKIVKINADYSPQLSKKLGVERLPLMILYRDGKEQTRITGGLAQEELEKIIRRHTSGL